MNSELPEDGTDDVRVEDVVLRALFREGFNRLESMSGQYELSNRVIALHTFALDIDKKQTLMSIPEMVT